MLDLESKILGLPEEKEEKPVTVANYLADNVVWEVSKDGCGKQKFNGVMVREMLDESSKALVMAGKKVVEYNGFKFKR
jgi:hypothetical protein